MSVLACHVCGVHIAFVVGDAVGTCFPCSANQVFGPGPAMTEALKDLQGPANAQNATQSPVQNGKVVYGVQTRESRGRAFYAAGACRACGKQCETTFVPAPEMDGKNACYACWRAGR